MIPTTADHLSHLIADSSASNQSPTPLSLSSPSPPSAPSLREGLSWTISSSSPVRSNPIFTCSSTLLLLLITTATLCISSAESISCDLARSKCAFRTGCGQSLFSYMAECATLIGGKTDRCHVRCQNALVALVSSEEGGDLVNCDCEGSKHCEMVKRRIEVCRPAVNSAVAVDSIVSCTTARSICVSETMCRTALEYYNMFCRGLFQGSKCNYRCKNSLSILERQEKAAKLRTCFCDGTEDFPCKRVKYNTERYCYGRKPKKPIAGGGAGSQLGDEDDHPDNSIEVIAATGPAYRHTSKRHRHKQRTGQQSDSAGAQTRIAWPLMAFLGALLSLMATQHRGL